MSAKANATMSNHKIIRPKRSLAAVIVAAAAVSVAGVSVAEEAPNQTAPAPDTQETAARPSDGLDPLVIDQIEALTAEKASRTPAQAKIDSNLLYEIKRDRDDPLFDVVPDLITEMLVLDDELVLVDITADVDEALLDRIASLGGVVINSHPRYRAVRASLPLDAIEPLAGSAGVAGIRPADQAATSKVNTSEGDVAHRAASARADLGVDGTGVGVCTLSDSIDALDALQASGDLPAVSVLPGQSGTGLGFTSEGTAMLEIVHDLAPAAQLGFATGTTGQAQFAQNILDLRAAGCDVIVDDISYFSEPVFQDGIIADAVDTVVADGALYFSSASNFGSLAKGTSGVWEGDFAALPAASTPPSAVADGRGGVIHDFGDGTGLNRVDLGNRNRTITLQWSDPQAGSANDYDLYLLDESGETILASSTNVQDGNDDPFESFEVNGDITDSRVAVTLYNGDPRFLHLSANGGRLARATDGQTYGHSAATGAFSVAAVDVATANGGAFTGGPANPVESFSSDGPRRIFFDADGAPYTPGNLTASGGVLRQKPDIAAADGVTTATPGFAPFLGTSAAAPHAAAIAALMLDTNPTLTKPQVNELFAATALDIESPGVDNLSGYGIVDAFTLVKRSTTLVPLTPSRVLDTRNGATVGNAAGTGTPLTLNVAGQGGLPTEGVSAVALNVTVTQTANPTIGGGYVTVYPCGTRPDTSNLNFVAGETIANSVIAPVSATGDICFYVYGTAHLLADISGYLPTASGFTSLTPTRILNTRGGANVGNAAGTGTPLTLNVAGQGGLPTEGVSAVALNVTVTQTANPTIGGGYVTVYPCGTRPDTSNLNFVAGETIANSVIAPVSATGDICFYVYGTAHLLADISGYLPTASGFTSLTPTRILNTRGGANVGNAAGTGTPLTLNVAGQGGVPQSGVSAVALNVTVTQTANPTIGGGYVTVYPCGTRPDTSNLNFVAGETIANSVIAPVSATGDICFYVYGTAHLLADISGYR